MKDKTSSESRRKLIKSIAVGSGAIITGNSVPESWSRPVVDSVLLPAHAQTSGLIYSSSSIQLASSSPQGDNMFAGALDRLVPTAHAGIDFDSTHSGCAQIVGNQVDLFMQLFISSVLYYEIRALILLSGASSFVTLYAYCGTDNGAGVSVAGYDSSYMDILIGISDVFRIPAVGACVARLPDPICVI